MDFISEKIALLSVFKPKLNLDGIKDDLAGLVSKMETRLCKPEDDILLKGEVSDYLYFIHSGTVDIFIDHPSMGKRKGYYFEADKGDVVGEIGVVLDVPRTAYVSA